MRPLIEAARYLGAWRWQVPQDSVIFGEDIALAYGIDPMKARSGVKIGSFIEPIHPDDRDSFCAAIARASYYGGDLDFGYRLMLGSRFEWVNVTGTCVSTKQGRPIEYLGAVHVRVEYQENPLLTVADHLLLAAQLARGANEKSLAYFIDMAMMEAGKCLAAAEREAQKAKPRIAIVSKTA